MTRTGKILFSLVFALIFGGLAFYFSGKVPNPGGTLNPDTTSIKGCYVAKLAKDIYTIDIEKQEGNSVSGMLAFNNDGKDSSSGSFTGTFDGSILLGNYSFDSEGMHSDMQVIFKKVGEGFVRGFGPVDTAGDKVTFKDLPGITYDTKYTFIKSPNCLEHFTDSTGAVSFDFNPIFQVSEGDKKPILDWRLNAKQTGVLLATVFVRPTYLPGTNFSLATLNISRSSDSTEIRNCTVIDATTGEKNSGSATVGGFPFTKFTLSDAGAGNFYETTSYRGIVDGDCYAIEYTIHSTNVGNYSPDQGIKEFDKAKIQTELEKIVKSVKFLVNSN